MASNGLVANAKKTVFTILSMTKSECESELAKDIMVGEEKVSRSTDTKLLGVITDEKQKWKEQLSSKELGFFNPRSQLNSTVVTYWPMQLLFI